MKNKIYILFGLAFLYPLTAFAALSGLTELLNSFGGILNLVIRLVFGIALVLFFWGVAQFILKDAGNETTREEGKKKMMWGIIALFVMISIYGILKLIGGLVDVPVQTGNPSGTTQTYGHPGVVVPCWKDPSQNGCQY